MRTFDRFNSLLREIVERALDPSPDRYLDHVRIRNFGRPQNWRPALQTQAEGRSNPASETDASPLSRAPIYRGVFGK